MDLKIETFTYNDYVWLILEYKLHPDYDFPIPLNALFHDSPKGTFPSFFVLLFLDIYWDWDKGELQSIDIV